MSLKSPLKRDGLLIFAMAQFIKPQLRVLFQKQKVRVVLPGQRTGQSGQSVVLNAGAVQSFQNPAGIE